LDIYEATKSYDKSLNILRKLGALYPQDPGIKQRIQLLELQTKQAEAPPQPSTK
jgi:hypothetical protein